MVFLRLEVRVFPREQASNTGFFKSVLGGQRPENDDGNAPKKPFAGFLLTLEKPEDYTMGDLTYLIKEKWKALRPEAEQLVIKKLLDDTMPSIDLEVGMSVADVFVDRGKALSDGHDQRGIVRVVQKPNNSHAPERFPSVVQDFEGASEAYARKKSMKALGQAFSPIPEDPHDTPISSVEIPHEISNDASSSPPMITNGNSQSANSPSPRELRPRKRKQSTQERDSPAKEPRVEVQLQGTSSPERRKSKRISSFASPNRRLSYSKPAENGLGLGITGSPKAKRIAPSKSSPPLPPVPHSILSKSSKNTPSNPSRRISFADSSTPPANGHPNKTPSYTSAPTSRQAQKSSIPASSQSMAPPSSQTSNIIYPPGISMEKLQQINEEHLQQERTKEEARQLLDDPNANASLRVIAQMIYEVENQLKKRSDYARRKKLQGLLKEFNDTKDRLTTTAPPKKTGKLGKDKEIQESEEESDGSEDSTEESGDSSEGSEVSSEDSEEESEESEEESEEIEDGKKNKLFDLEAEESVSSKDDSGTKETDAPITISDSPGSDDQEMVDIDSAPASGQDDQISNPEQNDDASSENEHESPHLSGTSDTDDQEMVDLPPAPVNGPSNNQTSESEQNDDAGANDKDEPTHVPEIPSSHDQENNIATQEHVESPKSNSDTDSDSLEDDEEIEPEKEPETNGHQQEGQQEVQQEDQDSTYSPSDEDSDSDSDFDPNLTFPPLPGIAPGKSTQSTPLTQEPSAQSRPKTLKELLKIQKAEQAARKAEGQTPMTKPASAPAARRRNIFEEVDDSSESESDEDDGDILPNGSSGRLVKPRRLDH